VESPALLRKCKYAFLTLANYSLIAVSNALEPLRMANRLVGKEVYEWTVVSLDGQAAESSSGLKISPTGALDKLGAVDILFVCGGVNIREAVSPALLTALRRLADRRVPLGGLCTGGYALARAGLLENFRATIHWENLSALREEFPRVLISDQLFTIDRTRFTSSRPSSGPGSRSAYRSNSSSIASARTRIASTSRCVRASACPIAV
jgi:transcriptional regulator GlxA family with amidase domain